MAVDRAARNVRSETSGRLVVVVVAATVGRLRRGRLLDVRVRVRVVRVQPVRGRVPTLVWRTAAAAAVRRERDRRRRRQTADHGHTGHERGAAVRRVHNGVLVRGRVPPGTRARAPRTRGRRGPAVRHRGRTRRVGAATVVPRPPRNGRVLLVAVRAAGRRVVAGRVRVRGHGVPDHVRGGARLGPLRAAHRQRAVRRHRVRLAPVLLPTQRPDAGRRRNRHASRRSRL